jgi:hypothetical protein
MVESAASAKDLPDRRIAMAVRSDSIRYSLMMPLSTC